MTNARAHKYRAVATTVDGIKFPSKAEARYYSELKLREKAGEIAGLVLQPRFDIIINGKKIGFYAADFDFFDVAEDRRHIVDVKGRETAVFRLKKKIVEALYDIEIEVVKNGRTKR